MDINGKTETVFVINDFAPVLSGRHFLGVGEDALHKLEVGRRRHFDQDAVAVIAHWKDDQERETVQSMVRFHPAANPDRHPLALILGRHSQCDIPSISKACLRHAMLLLWPSWEGEAAFLECIDLKTEAGLGIGGPEPAWHVLGEGAARFGVGAAEVLVFQARAGFPFFPRGPRAVAAEIQRPHPGAGKDVEIPFPSAFDKSELTSELTMVRWSDSLILDLESIDRPQPHKAHKDYLQIQVEVQDLTRGVLIGRYSRCRASSELEKYPQISRVHVCVIMRRHKVWAVDCGSTNGTTVYSARRRERSRLGPDQRVAELDQDTRLLLVDREVRLRVRDG